MYIGSIYGWEAGRDDLFDPDSLRNRDDCLEPMRIMNQLAHQKNIALHTSDINESNGITQDFSLYIESVDFIPSGAKKSYLILYETPLTVPKNLNIVYLNQFDKIFTWNTEYIQDGLVDSFGVRLPATKFVQIYHPIPIPRECGSEFISPSYMDRPDFACLIASNRHANIHDKRELYSERVNAIKWFEKNAPLEFKLYGNGWRVPQKRLGKLGKLRYRLEKIPPFLLRKPVFPSYQGPAKTKYEILTKTKYCICFENVRDIPGYVTEKIFDCFLAGCVPIYLGDASLTKIIPEDCFINFREFDNYQALYKFLKSISPDQYLKYQNAIRKFLLSPSFELFSPMNFAKTILGQIEKDRSI